MSCPCGSGERYELCCGRYHRGELPPTPEALMRSRYSAYAKGEIDYIIDTTHPDAGPVSQPQVATFCQQTRFEKLEILETTPDTVTFRATLSQNGHDVSFTEKSTFAQVDGAWKYLRGDIFS